MDEYLRGFLPNSDPAVAFKKFSELSPLDELGQRLPSLLMEHDFRDYVKGFKVPRWPDVLLNEENIAELRLYYLRLAFVASAYINQQGKKRALQLPRNIAEPLVDACQLLNRPPILSYDAYALYNWFRFDSEKPIALGNIDTIQNFVHLYDEHWFILVHVEIEAIAAKIVQALKRFKVEKDWSNESLINDSLNCIKVALTQQLAVLRRIPEHMSPELYFKCFRPYIMFFEKVSYQGVKGVSVGFRGETGAQSTIMPLLTTLLKIPHKPSVLVDHLIDMRGYMPAAHRSLLVEIDRAPSIKVYADKQVFNEVLELMAKFRECHYGYALEYIHKHVDDARGTGGTPYMHWLEQLILETRAHQFSNET